MSRSVRSRRRAAPAGRVTRLPGTAEAPTPYLSYTPNAYLGRMTEVILANAPERLYLDRLYETDMAEGLKAMALAGHGIAFLPHSAVEDAVADGKLIRLDRATRGTPEGQLTLTMEIRLYRDKLAAKSDDARQILVRQLWEVVSRGTGPRHGLKSCFPTTRICGFSMVMQKKHNRIRKRHWISKRRFSTMLLLDQRRSVHVIPATSSTIRINVAVGSFLPE